MTQPIRNFVIGLTSLAAIIGLIVLLMLFGELEDVFKPRYLLTINATHAAGLRRGSTIELNGVPVGVVDEIDATSDPQFPVRVEALIDRATRIPSTVEPFATAALLGGSATLQLEVPNGAGGAPPLSHDGSAHLDGEIRSRLMEQLTEELGRRMEPLLAGMDEFRTLARNLNELVEPSDGTTGTRNIRTAVEKLNDVLVDVQEALAMAKSWLGDEVLRADARQAVSNANVLIEKATQTLDRYAELAAQIETDSATVTRQLVPVLGELSDTLATVRGLAERAGAGDGTVAQLLNNPDLYRSLNDAAVQLNRTLLEIRMLVEKLKAEGVDINL